MRVIFRKLYYHQALNEGEYGRLMQYSEDLRAVSPESYMLFYDRFAAILYLDYHTYLPRFAYGIDDVYNYLLNNPCLIDQLRTKPLSIDQFPSYMHEYLAYAYPNNIDASSILPQLEIMKPNNTESFDLPEPRRKDLICKYEEANPFKEIGLKTHFDRIGRYSFISRLQSVRYLRSNKATEDKIEVVSGDCLGGIFTNKEKSIYYYIFLTENDSAKALNACRVLNQTLYGNYTEE